MAVALAEGQNYYLVEHLHQLPAVANRFRQRGTRIYADTETTGLNPRTHKLVMLQLMQEGGVPVIIDCRTFPDGWASVLKPLEELVWVGHNFSGFDWAVLAANGIHIKRVFDTLIAEQLIQSCGLDDEEDGGIALADVVAKYAGVTMDKSSREWFYKPAPLDERPEWGKPFPLEELEYGANDVLYLPTVFKRQCQALTERGLLPTMQLEMRALPAIAKLRLTGIHIDVDGWRDFIQHKAEEARELEAELYASKLGKAMLQCRINAYDKAEAEYLAWEQARDEYLTLLKVEWEACKGEVDVPKWGEYKNAHMKEWREVNPNPGKPKADMREVNFGSSKQMMETLTFLDIPIPTKRDKKTGEEKRTVDAESIEKIAGTYPVLKPLLKFRKCQKFVDAFGEKLLSRVEEDGRIHPEYRLIGADTGRMSCRNPNWQQIPSRGDGKKLRANVTAPEGYVLLTADLPNIELRILADESQDENMLAMFASGEDLHSFTARRMFGIPDDVDPKTFEWKPGLKARELAKTVNFGVAYGQSYMGLATKFNLPEDDAKQVIETWNALYSGARQWLTEQGDLAIRRGYSLTAAGRKKFFELPKKPDMRNRWSDEAKAYRKAEGSIRRQAMNFPMQGLCADIVKLACAEYNERSEHGALCAVVHDELVVQVPREYAESEVALLSEVMGDACRHWLKRVSIPEIDVNVGDRWEKV